MHFNNIFPLINNPTILCRPQDAPLYYTLPELAATLKMVTPPAVEVHAAILNAGYKYSRVHHESTGFKTDAPPTVIWDIMRACAKSITSGSDIDKATDTARQKILDAGFDSVDYVAAADRRSLSLLSGKLSGQKARLLIAATCAGEALVQPQASLRYSCHVAADYRLDLHVKQGGLLQVSGSQYAYVTWMVLRMPLQRPLLPGPWHIGRT